MGSDGFEPPKLEAADLQSAPFGHSGNYPSANVFPLSRRASCRIRTNDPEITNHVLWPTELKRRGGQAIPIAPLQPSALATFPSWGIQRELVVRDLPVFYFTIAVKADAKIHKLFISGKEKSKLFLFLTKNHKFGSVLHYL